MSGRLPRVSAALAAAVAAATVLVACGRSPEPAASSAAPQAASRPAVAAGDPAPDVGAVRIDGTPVQIKDLRGEVVLLNLWATWCKPCREEIPALDRLHREFGSAGLTVVGASLDDEAGSAEVEDFARRLGASYAIWIDAEDRIAGSFRPVGVPTTYLIDRDGVIRWRHVGPVKSDDADLREALGLALPR